MLRTSPVGSLDIAPVPIERKTISIPWVDIGGKVSENARDIKHNVSLMKEENADDNDNI